MRVLPFILAGMLACAALVLPGCAAYPDRQAVPMQATFASPVEAARALHRAARSSDIVELRRVLGRGTAMLVESGDDAEDELARDRFLAGFAQAALVRMNGDDSASLLVGKPPRTFPIPLVKIADRWHFEAGGAADQLVARRIARNEKAALEAVGLYVQAQRAYANTDHDGAGPGAYAQRIDSRGGKHDGLHWFAEADAPRSPLPLALAMAAQDDMDDAVAPHHGYFFRILHAQGPHAAGGAAGYLKDGRMTGGFALVAYPARYGASGARTFMVNQDGVVYAKDLGRRTAEAARGMRAFEPDRTWTAVPDASASASRVR